MNTSYLLDSSVLVLSLKQDTATHQRLSGAESLYVSTIALGELYYGAEHSIHVKRSLAEVEKLAQTLSVLNADSATARIYGHLKREQRTRGLMLPDNDLWIAVAAIQYGLTLAARDQHFTWITGLTYEQW